MYYGNNNYYCLIIAASIIIVALSVVWQQYGAWQTTPLSLSFLLPFPPPHILTFNFVGNAQTGDGGQITKIFLFPLVRRQRRTRWGAVAVDHRRAGTPVTILKSITLA